MQTKLKPAEVIHDPLGTALDAAGFVGTWETDFRTGVVVLHGPLAGLVGVEAERAVNGVPVSTFVDGIHGDDRQRVAHLIRVAHETAGRFEAEFRTLCLDGTTRWVSARGQVAADPAGRGLRCMGVAVDVTDTRRIHSPISEEDAAEMVRRLVAALVNARSSIETLGAPVLRTLIDVLLLEIGAELAKKERRAPAPARHLH